MKYFKIVENSINKSHSLISLFTKLFTAMLIFLGIITGISAVKEVRREVYSCLDEKFSMILYSVADLVNREEDITARKSTGTVTYTATETENRVILAIIFIVPVVIIVAGIVVWIIRRRKK